MNSGYSIRAGDHPGLRPAMRLFADGPREDHLPGPVPVRCRLGTVHGPPGWRILSPPRKLRRGGVPMLEALGIAPDVELVYRALLARPDTTATALAEVLERPEPDVETALRRPDRRRTGDPLGRPAVHRGPAGRGAGRLHHRTARRAAARRAGSGHARRGASGGGRRAEHQRPDRGRDRGRRDQAPLPAGAAGGHDASSACSSRRRSSPSRPGRTRPSRPRPTAASPSGRCWRTPCSPSPAPPRRRSTPCGAGSSCGSSTSSR